MTHRLQEWVCAKSKLFLLVFPSLFWNFMLFHLVNMCFFQTPCFYRNKGSCSARVSLLGGKWDNSHVPNLGIPGERCSVVQDDQRTQYYRFGITLPIWGRQSTESNLSNTYCLLCTRHEVLWKMQRYDIRFLQPHGHLQIPNMQQEITSIPRTMSLGEITSSYIWSWGWGRVSSVIISYRTCTERTGQGFLERKG